MQATQTDQRIEISTIQKQVLSTLSYFSVFNYPITLAELNNYLLEEIQPTDLAVLIDTKLIQHIDDTYYCLFDLPINIQDRINGNNRAANLKKKAIKRANFIGSFIR